jgi:hypothetical protein
VSSFTIPLPRYQCHKQVSALKVKALVPNPRGYELHFEDERFCPIEVTYNWYHKHEPVLGGYFVVYDDGYQSFSPAEAFEAGYSIIPGYSITE